MQRTVAVASLLLALSPIALAHGKEKYVMGTVTNISENSITVETTSKKSVIVQLTDKTLFKKIGTPATLKDLKVGAKVVVHADVSDDRLVAKEVHFGATKAKRSGKGMDHK
jgi:hypothetical protein